jgi:glutathione peroxidase-family protein
LQNHPAFAARPKHEYVSRTNSFAPTSDTLDKSIEWNFTKFLVSRSGVPLIRSLDDAAALEPHIIAALKSSTTQAAETGS